MHRNLTVPLHYKPINSIWTWRVQLTIHVCALWYKKTRGVIFKATWSASNKRRKETHPQWWIVRWQVHRSWANSPGRCCLCVEAGFAKCAHTHANRWGWGATIGCQCNAESALRAFHAVDTPRGTGPWQPGNKSNPAHKAPIEVNIDELLANKSSHDSIVVSYSIDFHGTSSENENRKFWLII